MKQILQSLRTGSTRVENVPCPHVERGHVLIRASKSLVSVGTERMLVEFGKAGLVEKALQQPDKVKMVWEKARNDGLMSTLAAVKNKLDQALPMGYSNVGVVVQVGAGVNGFVVGDRVVSNGKHAEVVSVPVNLCAKIPDTVTDDQAAFTVIGAIALQGIRLIQPTLGEAIVVIGLGLIGLVAVQLLRANGCRVIGADFDSGKLRLAREFGADVVDLAAGEDLLAAADRFSRGRGVDAVLITASTKSSEPVHQAALMSRKRGRIVLVGVSGLNLSRADFYEKELSFQVSCSYGPGRYDPNYEARGFDYPVGFVRWTEQRNFEAVLDMLSAGHLNVNSLVTARFAIEDAEKAYERMTQGGSALGIVLEYPRPDSRQDAEVLQDFVQLRVEPLLLPHAAPNRGPSVGFLGAGGYSTSMLIPAFKDAGATLKTIASAGGVSAVLAGRKFGFVDVTTDNTRVLCDKNISAVIIATRHDSHARLVCEALRAGKHVFVEKPIAITHDQLGDVVKAYSEVQRHRQILMVGFNRRFAPHVEKIKCLLASVNVPKAFVMTINAGAIPCDHWTQNGTVGGGRIVGEVCHFIDLLRHLTGAEIVSHSAHRIDSPTRDTASIQLVFRDGSIGTVHYFANGNKGIPKERLEIFAGGRMLRLDNFRKLSGFGWPRFRNMNLWVQDKGQKDCVAAFTKAVAQGAESPILFSELLEVSRVTLDIAECLR